MYFWINMPLYGHGKSVMHGILVTSERELGTCSSAWPSLELS